MQLGNKAVSPLIATVLVTLFGVIMLGIALGVVNPTFRRAQDTSAVNDQFATLETLNAAVKEVASEPDGSRRVVPITVTAGTLRVNSMYDWLYFEYEPLEALGIAGTKGDIRIDQGLEFADYFSSYADGAMASPVWTNVSGQAVASSGAYSIANGTAYHNVSTLENWKFSASIANVSGATGGEVFVLPGNPESLVGYWTADEATGNTFYDWSGHGNVGGFVGNANGTLTNMNTTGNATSGWTTDCKYGGCLRFDKVNDYVITDQFAISGTDRTFSIWINTPGTTQYEAILQQNSAVTATSSTYINGLGGQNAVSNSIWLAVGDGVGGYSVLNASIAPYLNQWTHVVGVIRGGNETRIYINGVSVTNKSITIYPETVSRYVILGRDATQYFNGTIDDAKIWNRALSADEVLSEYSGARAGEALSASTNTTGLVAWWKFNEGSGSSATDDSMREYGKYTGAMKLDYTSDYVSVADSQSLEFGTNEYAISMWVRRPVAAQGTMISKRENLDATVSLIASWVSSAGTLSFQVQDTAVVKQSATSTAGAIAAGEWNHVVISKGTSINIFVNGVNATSSQTVSGGVPNMAAVWKIGGTDGYHLHNWNGTIDEVMIFNRSLSADEVKALYETSAKKLSGAGGSQSITAKTPNPAIVLANPAGTSKFDSVEVTSGASKLTLTVPYTTVELNGTLRLQKGEHRVQIRHMATNATTNKPIIELTVV